MNFALTVVAVPELMFNAVDLNRLLLSIKANLKVLEDCNAISLIKEVCPVTINSLANPLSNLRSKLIEALAPIQ